MAGLSGPLMWIHAGRFDCTWGVLTAVVADIKFPRQYGEDVDLSTVIAGIMDNLNSTFAANSARPAEDALIPGQPELSGPALTAPVAAVGPVSERARRERDQGVSAEAVVRADTAEAAPGAAVPGGSDKVTTPSVVIELDLRFKDIKASMPIFTRELSYSTYTLARPIVAFMNANKTLIPVSCRVVMDLVRGTPDGRTSLTARWTSRRRACPPWWRSVYVEMG